MSAFGMIGLYFSEEVTITLEQYGTVLKMLKVDDAIVYTALANRSFEKHDSCIPQFHVLVIPPSRSPDLTKPDFFLRGYVKSKSYVNKPHTMTE
jgi:hypothetical protein